MSSTTVTLTAPTDPSAYRRWLAGKVGALASRTSGVAEPIDALDAEMLRDAARNLLDALDAEMLRDAARNLLDALDAEMLRDAARNLLDALDAAERQGGIQ